MILRGGVAIFTFVLVLSSLGNADEGEKKSHNLERHFKRMKASVMKEVEMALKKKKGHPNIAPLGKQLRLSFRLEPVGKDDKPFAVSVAKKQYGMKLNSREATFGLQISGQLALVGETKDKVGMAFQSGIDFKKGDTTGHVDANGSAIVSIGGGIGGEAELTVLGDKTLMVSVKEIE
ncbi:MAG: hypothetical protein CME25_14970 [Gemmatimonadetes bacterium]|nr:hypothetical protein [Gemmatimonadota bacterium]